MTTTAPALTVADVLRTMDEGIARLEAAAAGPAGDDKILAWVQHGLGVRLLDGRSQAVALDRADAFTPYSHSPRFAFPVVMNGNRETARLTTRREAIAVHLVSLRTGRSEFAARVGA